MGKSRFGDLTQELLESEINSIANQNEAKVYNDDKNFLVLFESNRLYTLNDNGDIINIDKDFKKSERKIAKQLDDNTYGTEEKPYEINCIEDLLDVSMAVNGIKITDGQITYTTSYKTFQNKYFILTKDLNFKSILSYEDSNRTDYGNINGNDKIEGLLTELTTGKGWMCIGGYEDTKNGSGFSGNFNVGENAKMHSIKNIYINKPGYAGLFGSTLSASIFNITLTGKIISTDSYAGGVVGYQKRGNLNNIKNYAIISGNETGGIVGRSEDGITINKCCNLNEISGVTKAGGVVGYLYGANANNNIDKCYNISNVISSSGDSGGIIGSGTGYSGGQTINIKYSYNTGNIKGSTNAGGIIARYGLYGPTGETTNCYNVGIITSDKNKGGISTKENGTKVTLNSCFCINGQLYVDIEGTEEKDSDYMKTGDFLNDINPENENIFVQDTSNINDGYPILRWQSE